MKLSFNFDTLNFVNVIQIRKLEFVNKLILNVLKTLEHFTRIAVSKTFLNTAV